LGAAGGEAADEDLGGGDVVRGDDLGSHVGDGLAIAVAPLAAGLEPQPALVGVGGGGLLGIEDVEVVLLREQVHLRACVHGRVSEQSKWHRPLLLDAPVAKSVGFWVQPCSMTNRGAATSVREGMYSYKYTVQIEKKIVRTKRRRQKKNEATLNKILYYSGGSNDIPCWRGQW
jgi:hypothetical protein